MSRVPASVGASTASGVDSWPVQIYNGGDTYSWHLKKNVQQHVVKQSILRAKASMDFPKCGGKEEKSQKGTR